MKYFKLKIKNMQNMNKKIYHLILLLLFVIPGMNAQTVKIHDVVEEPGVILVEIEMMNFTNVGAISLIIDYDDELLFFGGHENSSLPGIESNSSNGQITVGGFFNPSVNINDKLLDLKFTYLGGFDTPLDFAAGCEIADGDLEIIPTTFLDGSVTQVTTSNTVTMVSPTPVSVGTIATIPIQIVGPDFTAVNAITLKVAYDPDQLEYAGKDEIAITGVTTNAADGLLTLEWEDANAAMDFTLLTTLMEIKFTYNGGGNADLEFVPGCEISDDGDPFPVNFEHAVVTPNLDDAAKLTIETKYGTPGTNVILSLTASDFDDYDNQVGAITLKIGYDPAKLTYTNYVAIQPNSGWVVSASGGVLTMQRSNTGGVTLNNEMVQIGFNYHGGGAAPVVFNAGTSIETTGLVTIPLDLVNGGINPADHDSKLILGQVSATTGDMIQVPITVEGFTDDVAAISLKIGFPAGELISTSPSEITIVNTNFTGWKVNSSSNQITLHWSKTGGETLDDGILLYLNFIYEGTGLSPVVFNPGVELTDPNGDLIPISMVDGLVGPFIGADLKVFLQGPWNGTDMNTHLLDNGLIPLEQPYVSAPWNYNGTEEVDAIPDDVVDWVLVELRTGLAASTVEARRAGFLLKDGSVVDLDGSSSLSFYSVTQGDYYIVVKHRNHLAVMSATPQTLSVSSTTYDFTDDIGKAYQNAGLLYDQMATLSAGVFGMWGGDVNVNGITRYSGPSNDRQVIFNLTGNIGVILGYLSEDVNLRGQARYNGIQNDRAAIFNFVGNNAVPTHVPN
jgi:hypothetical protein